MIDIKDLKVDDIVWVCDFRYRDYRNKPIRNIKPTQVIIRDLGSKYISLTFYPLKNGQKLKKIIKAEDNVSSYHESERVKVFATYEECKNYYLKQCEENIKQLYNVIDDIMNNVERIRDEMELYEKNNQS